LKGFSAKFYIFVVKYRHAFVSDSCMCILSADYGVFMATLFLLLKTMNIQSEITNYERILCYITDTLKQETY